MTTLRQVVVFGEFFWWGGGVSVLAPRPPGSEAAFQPVPDGSVLPYLTDKGLALLDEALEVVGGAVVASRPDRSVIGVRYRNRPVLVDPATYRTAEQLAAEEEEAGAPSGLEPVGGVADGLPGIGARPDASDRPVRLLGSPVIAVADRDALVLALAATVAVCCASPASGRGRPPGSGRATEWTVGPRWRRCTICTPPRRPRSR